MTREALEKVLTMDEINELCEIKKIFFQKVRFQIKNLLFESIIYCKVSISNIPLKLEMYFGLVKFQCIFSYLLIIAN